MTQNIRLAHRTGYCPKDQNAIKDTESIPFLNHNKVINKNQNGTSDTFDSYTFKTDWNGSSSYLRYSGNMFSKNHSSGLRFYTSTTIGKDRRLYYQIWERSGPNLYLPNVIGFTGMWRNTNRTYHPRLDMVCFHYCNSNGTRTLDYRPTEALVAFSESNHVWHYGKTGTHDSGSDWYIGYQLTSGRRTTIVNNDHRLLGISLDIDFRTGAGSAVADGTFWHFQPIISVNGHSAALATASSCKGGNRMVIPSDGNNYPVSSSHMRLT